MRTQLPKEKKLGDIHIDYCSVAWCHEKHAKWVAEEAKIDGKKYVCWTQREATCLEQVHKRALGRL